MAPHMKKVKKAKFLGESFTKIAAWNITAILVKDSKSIIANPNPEQHVLKKLTIREHYNQRQVY